VSNIQKAMAVTANNGDTWGAFTAWVDTAAGVPAEWAAIGMRAPAIGDLPDGVAQININALAAGASSLLITMDPDVDGGTASSTIAIAGDFSGPITNWTYTYTAGTGVQTEVATMLKQQIEKNND